MFLRLCLFAKGKDICRTDICCKREVCFALLRNHKAEHMQLSNISSHLDGLQIVSYTCSRLYTDPQ